MACSKSFPVSLLLLFLTLMLMLVPAVPCRADLLQYCVDRDVVGGDGDGRDWDNAYSSLNACLTAKAQDLTDDGGDTCIIWCRAKNGTADTTLATVDGWTTNATCHLTIQGYDFPATGILDVTKYRLYNNDAAAAMLTVSDQYVRLVNLQFVVNCSSTNTRYALTISNIDAGGSDIRVDSCIFAAGAVMTGTGASLGIYVNNADATVKVFNCTGYGFISASDPGDTAFLAFRAENSTTTDFYNCTAYGNYIGFRRGASGTVTCTNCASGNNTDNFSGTITVDYCISDGGEGGHPQSPSGGLWTNEMTDPANGNFSLKAGGNCVGHGFDNPGSGLYSDDIRGVSRSSTWDIGAFEYTASGAPIGAISFRRRNQ